MHAVPDVLVVGHVSRDRVIVEDAPPREQPGGSAFYAACVHARLGLPVTLLSRVAARDRKALLQPLQALSVRLAVRPSPATTVFVNVYRDGVRTQRVSRQAPPIRPADFGGLHATAIQLGPLTASDLPPAAIAEARTRATWLALDMQGLLRRVAGGRIRPAAGLDKALLRHADIVKVDMREARLLTGRAEPAAAARRIAKWCGGEAIVTLGGDGAVVAAGARLYEIPPVDAGPVEDTTGCGDSFLAGYLARRLAGDTPPAAGRFAAGVASIKATRYGPFEGDPAAVRDLLERAEAP